jgi:predicted Zn-dependent peptidase
MLKDLKKNLISDQEIRLAKKLLNTQEELLLETHEDYSNYLEKYLVYQKKIEKLPARIKKRNSVTPRQLLNLTKRFFVNSKFVFVYLGPKTRTKKLEKALSF